MIKNKSHQKKITWNISSIKYMQTQRITIISKNFGDFDKTVCDVFWLDTDDRVLLGIVIGSESFSYVVVDLFEIG